MFKHHKWLVGLLVIAVCLAGCQKISKTGEESKQLDYTVVPTEDIPELLKKEIDKKKMNKFEITYEEGEFMYLAAGYGQRESFGFDIKVNQLYEQGDYVCLNLTLKGPEEGQVVKKSPSYPFIVIKTKSTAKKVEFQM
ncbi:MAG: protease complex subunit PrcB family protein [Eubacterium sp.]|nr:protease complex subunit PrcB family protein [Eubacterium sp.]